MLIIHILIEDFTQHTYIYNLTRRRIRLDTNETCQRYLYKIRNTKLVLEKGGGRRQIYLEREGEREKERKKRTRRSKSVSLTARERSSQVQIAHKGARNEREVKGERERKRGRRTGDRAERTSKGEKTARPTTRVRFVLQLSPSRWCYDCTVCSFGVWCGAAL